MVNINKRQEAKENTRALILKTSASLIREKGITALTTAEISTRCGISHGNLFQHFGNRESLINSVLEIEIKSIASVVKNRLYENAPPLDLLEEYLRILAVEEDFFISLYRELPFLPEEVNIHVISMEAILRNAFFLSLKTQPFALEEKELSLGLDAFFAMVVRLLTMKKLYTPDSSVIAARKSDLINLFNMLFMKGGEING